MNINKIENIQRRFTKTIFPQLPYSERLVKLHLPTLEMRRVMADLTTCYKLLNGLIDIDSDNFFVASNNTRTIEIVVSFKKSYRGRQGKTPTLREKTSSASRFSGKLE